MHLLLMFSNIVGVALHFGLQLILEGRAAISPQRTFALLE
jgi:hypothetical protein